MVENNKLSPCRDAFEEKWQHFHMNTDGTYSDNVVNSHWQEFKRGWQTRADAPQIADDDFHFDALCVDQLAQAQKKKLKQKREEGRGGWQYPDQCSADDLSRMLREHVEKGDPVDVANFAMMLFNRGERITNPTPPITGERQDLPDYEPFVRPEEPQHCLAFKSNADRAQFLKTAITKTVPMLIVEALQKGAEQHERLIHSMGNWEAYEGSDFVNNQLKNSVFHQALALLGGKDGGN